MKKPLSHLCATAPVLTSSLGLLLFAELAVIFLFPLILPENWYLYLYLLPEARESTFKFLNNQKPFLEYDAVLGWRNRPNVSRETWQIDEYGSRASHPFTFESAKPKRVVFVGNSLINGGTDVTNNETISAFLQDSHIEAINFGTMMYSLDQVVLAWEKTLCQFKGDVLVVGLSGRPCEGLVNQYVSFRKRHETNLPYLKPRFRLTSETLQFIPVPAKTLHLQLFENGAFLNHLKDTDAYYADFQLFKRFGFLPVSGMILEGTHKYRNFMWYFREDEAQFRLLKKLMTRLENTAQTHGFKVLFLILPDLNMTSPGLLHRMLPDRYQSLIEFLSENQFTILDVRDTFRKSEKPVEPFYTKDLVHFSVEGNRLIAHALKKKLIQLEWLQK